MKIRIFFFCFLLVFSLYPLYNYASSDYKEVHTSLGKVIVGLNKDMALEKFGLPTSATENIWYYSGPETFFIYFPPASLLSIHLYPQFCETTEGVPLEFRALGYFSDFKVQDITSQVQFLFSDPQNFSTDKPRLIIPQRAGEYQIRAKYKDIISNPAYITIKGSQEETGGVIEKEKLLSIDILPFKPKVSPDTRLSFVALGTFFDSSKNRYFIRDISQEVMWFTQQDKDIVDFKDNPIYFPSVGRVKVFCKYQNLESFPQEVEVQDNLAPFKETIKHITLLPEFIFTNLNNDVTLRAFGTYYNNRVEDITSKVKWKVSDKEIITQLENGEFLPKSEGITEVIAELDDLESLPAKIIVVGKKDSLPAKEIHPKDLIFIRIIPDYLRIPLGEKRQLTAQGRYSDNSQADLTLLGEWMSSNDKVATVSKGRIDTASPGETKIYIKIKGITSLPASVVVEEAQLVSIIISPQNSQISMMESLNLKAEGYFTDSSRKDITSLVNWKIAKPRIIKIKEGKVRPLRIGQTQVRAEYLGLESLPADIKVVMTKGWLIYLIIKGIAFLMLGIIIIFLVLYFLTKKEKNKLEALFNKNPREFIVSIYENVKKILSIFGLSYQESIPPLSYAKLVEDRYSIKDNLFLRFTTKFEEAKYSYHILESNDAASTLNDYQNFLRILFGHYNNFSLVFKYCLTLIYRKPLFIRNS